MASSDVDIVNIALSVHLGAESISSFSEDSKEAVLARTSYAETRDEVLRAHPWNCAVKRVSLVANADAPDWGFDIAYQLPSDYLRVMQVNGETASSPGREGYLWQVEDGKILTDLSAPLEILYIYRNTVVTRYDAELVNALSYKLALKWVEPLVKAANLKAVMADLYRGAISSARGSDGQEGSPKRIQSSMWLDVR